MKYTTEQLKYWLDMIFSEPMRDIITECLESRAEIAALKDACDGVLIQYEAAKSDDFRLSYGPFLAQIEFLNNTLERETKELDQAREEIEKLREALEKIADRHDDWTDAFMKKIAKEALSPKEGK